MFSAPSGDVRLAGLFIVIEGAEGSGKTTQVEMLRKWLVSEGLEVVCVREPGGTQTGDKIRTIIKDPTLAVAPETELLLFEASRCQLVREVIKPALEAGKVVIADRFTLSTEVYQGSVQGLPHSVVQFLNRLATDGVEPDLTVVLDVGGRVSRMRLGLRVGDTHQGFLFNEQPDRIERRGLAFLTAVARGYRKLARRRRKTVLVAADRPPEEVHLEIRKRVARLLRATGGAEGGG